MRITIFASATAPHQLQHQQALATGLRALGHDPVLLQRGEPETEAVACWGWHKGAAFRAQGRQVLVMERGYLGDRFSWTSLAWNGLNGRGIFAPAQDDGGARYRAHFPALRPWFSDPEGYALIIGQVPGDASLQGKNLEPWYAEMAHMARAAGMRPVFRQHPVAAKRGVPQAVRIVDRHSGPLAEALAGARQVITYNSNTGVDAALAGVPFVADNEGSMAWPVAGREVGEIHMPDREQWAHDLAWKQWRLSELQDGTALKGLL